MAKFSIGTKLALRYTAAMSVTVTLIGLFVFTEIQWRINREARLLLEVYRSNLVEAYRGQVPGPSQEAVLRWLSTRIREMVSESEPSLHLGVDFLDDSGQVLLSAGSLEKKRLPLSRTLLAGIELETFRVVNLGGRYAYLATATAVPRGFIRIVIDSKRYADNVEYIRQVFLLSLPLVLVLTGFTGWFMGRSSLRPLSEITATARRIRGENLNEEIPVSGSGDELDQLAMTLNEMMLRIRQSVSKMQRSSANSAHELRTPLNAIRSQIEVTLTKSRDPVEYQKVLNNVLEHVDHLTSGIEGMLRLARSEGGLDAAEMTDVHVADLIAELIEFFAPLAQEQELSLHGDELPNVVVRGDPSWLYQLFGNLITNAIKYNQRRGEIEVLGECDEHWLRVAVRDTGRGLPAEEIAHIFERFHRVDRRVGEHGFGLGLAIAQEIAKAHGGRIDVESELGQGSTFRVWLPLAASSRVDVVRG